MISLGKRDEVLTSLSPSSSCRFLCNARPILNTHGLLARVAALESTLATQRDRSGVLPVIRFCIVNLTRRYRSDEVG